VIFGQIRQIDDLKN